MKKYVLLLVGVTLIIGSLAAREWLLLEEILVTENQVKEQIALSLENAQSLDRVKYFTTSSVTYERYLEPVFDLANRLLWPNNRIGTMTEWKREIHARLDDLSNSKIQTLGGQAQKEIQKLRSESKPSLSRLFEILTISGNKTNSGSACTAIAQEEMTFIKQEGQKRDQEILAALKEEGVIQLKQLEKALKGMNAQEAGKFLTSGRFVREIETPILEYVLQIKQEELRKAAWREFEKKLSDTLERKKISVTKIAKIKDRSLRAKGEIEKLFNSMAEAKGPLIDTLKSPSHDEVVPENSQLVYPETLTPPSPSDADLNTEGSVSSEGVSPASEDSPR